jgi:phosphoglycerate dehydrogenase-like enzyme
VTLPRAALAMSEEARKAVIDAPTLAALNEVCSLAAPLLTSFDTTEARAVLADVDVLVTSWGCPPVDAAVLDAAPRLRAIVHAAGSVRAHVTAACWDRGIVVSSAAAANALPVAEYTLAMILLSGKRALERARDYRLSQERDDWLGVRRSVGNYGRTVGILSASMVGRRVIELLKPFDLRVLLHDPYVSEEEAASLGVAWVDIEELFERSDVVSVHTPLLPETVGLVSRALIDVMPPDAVLINTARGAVVDQVALADAAAAGRIRAILDVTEPEVLLPTDPLWHSDNVLITPHLAGSQGNEWARLAASAVAELGRWAVGADFAYSVTRERLGQLA